MTTRNHKIVSTIVSLFYMGVISLLIWVVIDQNKYITNLKDGLQQCVDKPIPLKTPRFEHNVKELYQVHDRTSKSFLRKFRI